jgi:MinD superfamily P-loop ATPase
MKKINIVTGHYGSGKTEFAINYALKLKDVYGSSVICDMDIVNPYFRTNDAVDFLKKENVNVIAPE